jgi:tyrosyl-tRNA synthetase
MPVFERFLTFGDGPTDAILLDNAEWLDRLEYIPFLRDIGQHFSVNRMLSFESVKLRLDREQSLSFLEFNYMILQAYDFLELSRRSGCRMQLGGSDQWGNIVNGVELARRVDGRQVFGVTTPLLTTADGKKMGKTRAGRCGSTPISSARTTSGNIGGTWPTPTWPGSCACSPTCRWTKLRGWRRCRGPRSTRPRKGWPTR